MRSPRRSRGQLVAAAAASLLGLTVAAAAAAATRHPGPPPPRSPLPASHASPGTPSPAAPSATPPPGAASCPATARTAVSSASGLKSALASARPGETIVLAPGVYSGNFTASRSGTASAPITLCGSRNAVLQGQTITEGYTFYLDHASWWRVEGFAVQGGQKGVMADGASHDVLDGLYVHGTGDEAIHLRSFSTDDTISHCVVRDTGLLRQSFGEGSTSAPRTRTGAGTPAASRIAATATS